MHPNSWVLSTFAANMPVYFYYQILKYNKRILQAMALPELLLIFVDFSRFFFISQGNQMKSVEDDPNITPGSVRSPLLALSTMKDTDIFTSVSNSTPVST